MLKHIDFFGFDGLLTLLTHFEIFSVLDLKPELFYGLSSLLKGWLRTALVHVTVSSVKKGFKIDLPDF